MISSPGSTPASRSGISSRLSPTPSLRPFDRRFKSGLGSSQLHTPRPASPAFLNVHSRHSSSASQIFQDTPDTDVPSAPWEVIRWTKLRNITGQIYSEVGKRNFGRPTCLTVSTFIIVGTSKGLILVFDYQQNLKATIGLGTSAVECGAVTSLAISADHSTVAGGHANGHIFTWEVSKPGRPFLQIQPGAPAQAQHRKVDGHLPGVPVLHLGFLGTRRTALVSADDRGMAFSHLATRGMGVVARTVRTTRILGRYPDDAAKTRSRKPSSVLAFSPLPLGNAEQITDGMGMVAMLTPYLLVVVSTTPVAQTQHKTPRPKEVTAHGAMSAALAWFPAVKLKAKDSAPSKTKLVFCWSNILTVMDIEEVEPSEPVDTDKPPALHFTSRSRWKSDEAIVAVQWLSRSVLAILTITQQLIILEDYSMRVSDSFDLLQKHIYHADIFSSQLYALVEQLDEEDASMHGVVADAFYMSFRAYKGRLFLLGHNDVSMGNLSNWADRLFALMEAGDYIGAIQLATSYYTGDAEKLIVGLPEKDEQRHTMVEEKLREMMSASLRYAFGRNERASQGVAEKAQLEELAASCLAACVSLDDMDFLFEDVYTWFEENAVEDIFLSSLEPYILDGEIKYLPPTALKALISYCTLQGQNAKLEEMLCLLDTMTMDIDQVTTLCKQYYLYEAFIYVWNQAIKDYVTPLQELIRLAEIPTRAASDGDAEHAPIQAASAAKMFPYLAYTFTNRTYPTGDEMTDSDAYEAKSALYAFLFSGARTSSAQQKGAQGKPKDPFYPLKAILNFDAASFLGVLNEAFEDSFLNGQSEGVANGTPSNGDVLRAKGGVEVNRQYVLSILLDIMSPEKYDAEDVVYLDMFIARNLPKYPQYILLSGSTLHQVLVRLCQNPLEELADDRQLSVEYLLSMYHPPDIQALIPVFAEARFWRVLKTVYRSEKQYAALLETCFKDEEDKSEAFGCILECLRPQTTLTQKQVREVRDVVRQHARELASIDVERAAELIDDVASDMHPSFLKALNEDPGYQYRYLGTLLGSSNRSKPSNMCSQHGFVEHYVRLMCSYNPAGVADYVEDLKSGDLRLEEVLPAMETGGIIDAAVVLLARQGQIKDAMQRLRKHLETLEAALVGLLQSADESPDTAGTEEAIEDLIASLEKYVGVGIWLCQGQAKSMKQARLTMKSAKRQSQASKEELSFEEGLWLDLISSSVRITRNVSSIVNDPDTDTANDPPPPTMNTTTLQPPLTTKITTSLRKTIQQIFTALLASTTTTRDVPLDRTDYSFLRILRAFLTRAAAESSLSELRTVIASIFSAYSYEESLLALANSILDKDLFVHVDEAVKLRQRGWRPRGQICEGCRRRVWGPGAGKRVWDAWEAKTIDKERRREQARMESSLSRSEGKGKAAREPPPSSSSSIPPKTRSSGHNDANDASDGGEDDAAAAAPNGEAAALEDLGPLVIFSCRHIFHRVCLQRKLKEQNQEREQDNGESTRADGLLCPVWSCSGT